MLTLPSMDVGMIHAALEKAGIQFEADAVREGLSIMPKKLDEHTASLTQPGTYACYTCGHVETFHQPVTAPICRRCGRSEWCPTVH